MVQRYGHEMKPVHEVFTEQRIEFQNKIIRSGHWVTCLNCEHFKVHNDVGNNKDDICGLFKMRPPSHVIVNGCKDHIDDIPF